VQNFAGAFAQDADGLRFATAAAGEQNRDGRVGGTGTLDDFADFYVRKGFGTGDNKVCGSAAEFFEELAAVLGKFNGEGETGVACRRSNSMMRKR
jgi:hypothetical protein